MPFVIYFKELQYELMSKFEEDRFASHFWKILTMLKRQHFYFSFPVIKGLTLRIDEKFLLYALLPWQLILHITTVDSLLYLLFIKLYFSLYIKSSSPVNLLGGTYLINQNYLMERLSYFYEQNCIIDSNSLEGVCI